MPEQDFYSEIKSIRKISPAKACVMIKDMVLYDKNIPSEVTDKKLFKSGVIRYTTDISLYLVDQEEESRAIQLCDCITEIASSPHLSNSLRDVAKRNAKRCRTGIKVAIL